MLALTVLVVLYIIAGVALSCFNKWLLSDDYYGFSFPITAVLVHMATHTVCSALLIQLSKLKTNWRLFYVMSWRRFTRLFVPIGMLTSVDLTLANLAFEFIAIALYEIIKSGVIVLLIIAGILRRKDTFTWLYLPVVALLIAGIVFTKLNDETLVSSAMAPSQNGGGPHNDSLSSTTDTPSTRVTKGFIVAMFSMFVEAIRLLLLEYLLQTPTNSLGSTEFQPVASQDTAVADRTIEALELKEFAKSSGHKPTFVDYTDSAATASEFQIVDLDKDTPRVVRIQGTKPPARKAAYEALSELDLDYEGPTDQPLHSPLPVSESTQLPRASPPSSELSSEATSPVSRTRRLVPAVVPRSDQDNIDLQTEHPIVLLVYYAPVTFVALLPAFFAFEYHDLVASVTVDRAHGGATAFWLFLNAMVCYSFSVLEMLLLKRTSALMLCVMAVAKLVAAIVITSIIFRDQLGTLNEGLNDA